MKLPRMSLKTKMSAAALILVSGAGSLAWLVTGAYVHNEPPLTALALMGAASVPFAWLLMNRFMAPLDLLARHVAGLTGKTGKERFITITTGDEIAALAEACNEMVADFDHGQEVLRKIEERYWIITEFTSEMALWRAPDGSIVYVSPNCGRITGYDDAEFYRSPGLLDEIVHADDRHLWDHHGDESTEDGMHRPIDYRIVTKEGAVRWLNHTCYPVTNGGGESLGIRGSFRDVTAYKLAEHALQAERQRLFSLLESLPGFVCLKAPDHSIRYANRYFRDRFGEVGGRPCYRIFLSREGPCALCPSFRVVAESGLRVWDWTSGDGYSYLVYDYPFTDVDGSPLVLELGIDISGQKRAERELKVSQAQLMQSEKMASIGQLAAGVAHEINNPIGFVSSNLCSLEKYVTKLLEYIACQEEKLHSITPPEIIRELEENKRGLKLDYVMEDALQLIRESLEGTGRVRKIVQDLKTFSRLDEAEFKCADINECLESTINIVWNEIKYKATLRKELGDLPPIKCYPQQLNQVFLNLLVNASHALDSQGEITLKTWSDAGFIHVSIADTGCGIPEEIQRRIFEPFFTTKEVGKGTGLGLSISYDIVKKHNGDIKVQSTVGKGTTVTVRLPVVA